MTGFKLDIEGLKRQIEQKVKPRLLQGVQDGFKDHAPKAEQTMTDYIQEVVYNVYEPKVYRRTYKLLNSVRSEVDGNTLRVAVDPTGFSLTTDGVPYPYRVAGGNEEHPYEYPVDGAAFMNKRDWATKTATEYKENAEQEGALKRDMVSAINRRLRGG